MIKKINNSSILHQKNQNIQLYTIITKLEKKINELEKRIKELEDNKIDNEIISLCPLPTPKNTTIDDFHKLMRENAESFDNLE